MKSSCKKRDGGLSVVKRNGTLRACPSLFPRSTHLCLAAAGAVLLFALYVLHISSSSISNHLLSFSSPPISFPSLQADIAELKKEQQSHQAQVRALRALLGALSCKVQGVGPTGGFCLSVESPGESPGLNTVDEGYAELLGELFTGQSVLDVGTGLGNYGRCGSFLLVFAFPMSRLIVVAAQVQLVVHKQDDRVKNISSVPISRGTSHREEKAWFSSGHSERASG